MYIIHFLPLLFCHLPVCLLYFIWYCWADFIESVHVYLTLILTMVNNSTIIYSTMQYLCLLSLTGTQAFMPPEMFEIPAQFSDKVDVFSFGCVIISTLMHRWPEPGPAKRRVGWKLVALTEYQRREHFYALLTPQEKELFLRLTEWCLQEDPSRRPFSRDVVESLVKIATKVEKATRGGIVRILLHIHTVLVRIEARAFTSFQRFMTRPLFKPGFYYNLVQNELILNVVSYIK